jgi:hypothetical protein
MLIYLVHLLQLQTYRQVIPYFSGRPEFFVNIIFHQAQLRFSLFIQAVRTAAHEYVEDGAELTPLELFAFFVSRCRSNLHVIIAFSPIGDAFRNRLRQYPSLINCCTIDWFQVRS